MILARTGPSKVTLESLKLTEEPSKPKSVSVASGKTANRPTNGSNGVSQKSVATTLQEAGTNKGPIATIPKNGTKTPVEPNESPSAPIAKVVET